MAVVKRKILEQVIAGTTEPLLVARVDQPDWPVALTNPAYSSISEAETLGKPLADVVESLAGREFALEVSEAIRTQQELSLPIEVNSREYLLALRPLALEGEESARYYAAYWRSGGAPGSAEGAEMHHALLKAKRQLRDLSRDDPVTGLLNDRAFADVFEHDWAVAARKRANCRL